ncbi:unnamed protein product [Sphenostylis stenocarpa]|uniref:Uncharacterized protein n=1 Tax=Sphenostylis stenocarpa TaxID=92480 RepID=A0AA86VPM2_9FABA|nr:unnamed protein product [Sphenostylis stenocarpa]
MQKDGDGGALEEAPSARPHGKWLGLSRSRSRIGTEEASMAIDVDAKWKSLAEPNPQISGSLHGLKTPTFPSHNNHKLSLVPLPFFGKLEGMDQVKSLKIESWIQSTKPHNYLIKFIQLLVSLSVFSFFISPSSLLAFLYHFNLYFSTFSLQLFTHTIDKNCMFLLCNGLLVFVGITRSLSGPSSVAESESSKYAEGGSQSPYSDVEANEPIILVEKTHHEPGVQKIEVEHAIEIKYSAEDGEQNIGNIVLEGEEKGKRNSESALKEDEEANAETGAGDEDNESEIGEFLIGESVEEEEVLEEEPNWVLSTEELNKKFDDFIRKMKEDLRIEAQRQLLMV